MMYNRNQRLDKCQVWEYNYLFLINDKEVSIMPPVQTERRHHQLRNFYSYEDRRLKPSIYPEASCCPACGCAVVQNGEYCRDCKEPMELEKEIGLMPFW